jgi:hypothetical protein
MFDDMNDDMILRLALERQAGLRDEAHRIRLTRTSRHRHDDVGPSEGRIIKRHPN